MNIYLDADIFLALIKKEDRLKDNAKKFLNSNKNYKFVTSSLTCLEIWFYLYRNNLNVKVLSSIRAIMTIAHIVDYTFEDLEASIFLSSQFNLSPADSIHAILALAFDGIVSSDASFDKVKGLKRIDFSKI
ncbi:type II toxin-antitoxin system VapC family toxin [Candidatus Woesearchaeota archaeon]|nr:type II toxin-antitoxin system VapC family toxin [Candidatus Woesearchaeota archaeon]